VKGKRAYEAAREGKSLELKQREVEIRIFEIDQKNFPEISFRVVCSKGTYIRSLVRDFGLSLQSGAYMSELRRTRIGSFLVTDALPVTDLAKEISEQRESLQKPE
jgi:tRNA pseudouridine55 synthase